MTAPAASHRPSGVSLLSTPRRRHRLTQAFTLVEVLVAMTILAVGVSALVTASGASAFRADYLRDREFARWVASNQLTQLQVLPTWPQPGTTNTEVEMMNTRWQVRTRTRKVSDPALRRVDIEVRRDRNEESYLYSVTGFLGDPALRELRPAIVVPTIDNGDGTAGDAATQATPDAGEGLPAIDADAGLSQ